MKKSIIIIGAGMGGLAAGIHAQRNGFSSMIFEAHHLPGGQCTSWNRKEYVFDGCLHYFGGGGDRDTAFNRFWRELGAFPCDMVRPARVMSAVAPDGTWFHDYYDLEKLESHMKKLSPIDSSAIDTYIKDIRRVIKYDNEAGMFLGSMREKLTGLPGFLLLLNYFSTPLEKYATRFRHPLLRKVFPLLHYGAHNIPTYIHLVKHSDIVKGSWVLPRGGGLSLSKNMAAHYEQLGGKIYYRRKVMRILVDQDQVSGLELEDGTRYKADIVVSNADGRKTIMQMLGNRYIDKRIAAYCEPNPDKEEAFAVTVFLGVKRDLSKQPAALIIFLDEQQKIAGTVCDHLDVQMYGCDSGLVPAGKGVIKVELYSRPSYFARLYKDRDAYKAEKNKTANLVITLLEKQYPGLGADIEVTDVVTPKTWERFMGGTNGFCNWPNKKFSIFDTVFNSPKKYTLPGLKNFYFAGQWVTSAGSVLLNAVSGKTLIRMICRQCRVKFKK